MRAMLASGGWLVRFRTCVSALGPLRIYAACPLPQKRERERERGGEAAAFIRSYGHGLSDDERAVALGGVWRRLSRVLQIGNAEMVLSAVTG